jgi:choline dehydrogenase-like flavoprotein
MRCATDAGGDASALPRRPDANPNDEVIADGERAADHPPRPGELSPWER